MLSRTIKPARIRDENGLTDKDEVRPTKKPRLPVTHIGKSGLSTATTLKRSALSDVSNNNKAAAVEQGALKKSIPVKTFTQTTAATRRPALADVKNTTSVTAKKGMPGFGGPNAKAVSTAAGRVIMKAKRKVTTITKSQAQAVEPAPPTMQIAEAPVHMISAETTERPLAGTFAQERRKDEPVEDEEEEEEMVPVKDNCKMDIEEGPETNPPLSDASELDGSTDDMSTDSDVDKRNNSVSELVEPMGSLLSNFMSTATSAGGPHSLEAIFANEEIEDIDAPDADDPSQVTEYVNEIFDLMREKERGKRMPKPRYMKSQREINYKMRAILVDWMLDVCVQFSLMSETQFLAVQLLDRLLSIKEVSKARIQLIGIAGMVIASKFEETRTPWVDDFVWISAEAFTKEEVLRVEKIMLSALDWDLTLPTPLHFLRRFSKAARSDSVTHTLSKYLTELSLPEYKMLRFVPSMIAAAAVYIARKMMNKTPIWNKTLQYYTKYSVEDMKECILVLNECHANPKEPKYFKSIVKKYANSALFSVSSLPAVTSFGW